MEPEGRPAQSACDPAIGDALAIARLLPAGQPERAVELIDQALARDPQQGGDELNVVRLLLVKLAALLNMERYDRCPAVVDALYAILSGRDEPELLGRFHALAGGLAYFQGALERCVTHLVRGAHALERVPADTRTSAIAWLDTAATYSYAGFHEEAVATLARAQKAAEAAGERAAGFAHPEIRVRHALWLDHHGDTRGCVRQLSDLYHTLAGERDVLRFDQPHLGYAGARLAALGVPVDPNPRRILDGYSPRTAEETALALLTEICLDLADGRTESTLSRLESPIISATVPAAEVLRVRSLALSAAGDYRGALADERAAAAAVDPGPGRLNSLYIEGVAARLDRDELRRSLTRYSDEANTDPLTGLPNRRHLESYVNDLTSHGTSGVIGVADMNGFKAINTVHGHLSGDEVLEQVAGVLSRALRTGDFLARYGGDEFVVIMPCTQLADATDVTDRLIAAVARFDWATLVPGTPVSLAVGLAEFSPQTDFSAAFKAADMIMLRDKAASGTARR
jgi:diguanylate cyclase (GGDEF)-like protein